MDDQSIIDLYFSRNEEAIKKSSIKYGHYCFRIAKRIVHSVEDTEEILNDTWLRAWSSIPPQRPDNLRLYFAKITRNLSLDRFRKSSTLKRSGVYELAYDELSECIASRQSPEDSVVASELESAIKRFLAQCSVTERDIFLRRAAAV